MKVDECLLCQGRLDHSLDFLTIIQCKALEWQVICPTCKAAFETCNQENQCRYCQHSLPPGQEVCYDCRNWLKNYSEQYLNHQSLFIYNDHFQEWITHFKYRGDARQAYVMREPLKEFYQQDTSFIWTYLPSSPSSLGQRGFTPTQYLLDLAQIPYRSILQYIGDQAKQAKKARSDRLKLVQPFKVKESIDPSSKYLIFDDVYTTGTTLIRAKEALFSAGAKQVMSLTLARDQLL